MKAGTQRTVRPLNSKIILLSATMVAAILFVLLASSIVTAARCHISQVSYVYPHQAAPNQQIKVSTIVAGSCASNGEEYYEVRVDLVDKSSNYTLSSGNTPIGYSANTFNVTAENPVTTPSHNVTWPLQVYVYVIRAGGTSGSNLFDYTTVGNATIQVGAGSTTVPEFPTSIEFIAIVALVATTLILQRRGGVSRIVDRLRSMLIDSE